MGDTLAAEEVNHTLEDGAKVISGRLQTLVGILGAEMERDVAKIDGQKLDVCAVEDVLCDLAARVEFHVHPVLHRVERDFVAEISAMLRAPVCAVAPSSSSNVFRNIEEALTALPAEPPAHTRFWSWYWSWYNQKGGLQPQGLAARSLFGTSNSLFLTNLEQNKAVIAKPLVQLNHYPVFVDAVLGVVHAECKRASDKMAAAATKVIGELVADGSMYVRVRPNEACDQATVDFVGPSTCPELHVAETRFSIPTPHRQTVPCVAVGSVEIKERPKSESDFVNALKMAFLRHLPSAASLKRALMANAGELRLSLFEEDESAKTKRRALDERIDRTRDVIESLIGALDIDQNKPLDKKWLYELQRAKGLPVD